MSVSPQASGRPVCIWRFFDGRAGHRNQVLGLSEAISRKCPVLCHDVDVSGNLRGFRSLIPGRLSDLKKLPVPDLLLGAGHATHIPILVSRRRFGGKSVVLMKPSLPLRLFDLCLIPIADGLKSTPGNVVLTEGAVNRVRRSVNQRMDRGLILVGGPSEHFGWSNDRVLRQLQAIVSESESRHWTITTSRRTPPSFLAAWKAAGISGDMVPVEQTKSDWLPRQLQDTGLVWVTSESVSMIYEALTSGAAVGLMELPDPRNTRVVRGLQSLISRRMVTTFSEWEPSRRLMPSASVPGEAERCAQIVIERLLQAVFSPGTFSQNAA